MKDRPSKSPRLVAVVAALVVVPVGAVALATAGGGNPDTEVGPGVEEQDLRGASPDSGFAVLSAADTNRCDLRAAELRRMPDYADLRGSCCFPMDRHRYGEQVRGLRDHARIDQIPADPYDVPVTLAKRLLGYRGIRLTPQQRATYREAMDKSELGGPCCCRCWRWQAFRGQANYLITRRDFSATQVARVWALEEGCGGTHDHA